MLDSLTFAIHRTMSNNVEDLEHIRQVCKKAIKELSHCMALADKMSDQRVVQRLHSAQSRLLFAKFAVHALLQEEFVEIVYDEDECSSNSICDECPC